MAIFMPIYIYFDLQVILCLHKGHGLQVIGTIAQSIEIWIITEQVYVIIAN